ncbi:hypothetical protein KFE25_011742 [Diacronema lutheri]|uniref:Uncharacterized protein n=1 Tax=Diacronema lutheri TaxID=2081491 RepID=A0A8J5X3C7_DIALT|nr:hypothetical protein KFE25_011742 [Diacronema lutheri]
MARVLKAPEIKLAIDLNTTRVASRLMLLNSVVRMERPLATHMSQFGQVKDTYRWPFSGDIPPTLLAALQQELQALSLVHAKRKADVRMFPYDLSKPDDVASLCSELASLPVAILVGVTRALRARGRRWRTLSRDPT